MACGWISGRSWSRVLVSCEASCAGGRHLGSGFGLLVMRSVAGRVLPEASQRNQRARVAFGLGASLFVRWLVAGLVGRVAGPLVGLPRGGGGGRVR